MKVLAWYNHNDLREESWPKPSVPSGFVRVAIKAVGFTNSEFNQFSTINHETVKNVKIIGRKASGIVEQVGKNVNDIGIGDVVILDPKICFERESGFLKEYIVISREHIIFTSAKLSFAALCETEVVALCYKALEHSEINENSRVGIIGGNIFGQTLLNLSKKFTNHITHIETNEQRSLVKETSNIPLLYASQIQCNTIEKFDVVFVAEYSESAIELAVNISSEQAKLILLVTEFGTNDSSNFSFKQLQNRKIFCVETASDKFDLAVRWLENNTTLAESFVTKRYAWDAMEKDWQKATNNHANEVFSAIIVDEKAEKIFD